MRSRCARVCLVRSRWYGTWNDGWHGLQSQGFPHQCARSVSLHLRLIFCRLSDRSAQGVEGDLAEVEQEVRKANTRCDFSRVIAGAQCGCEWRDYANVDSRLLAI